MSSLLAKVSQSHGEWGKYARRERPLLCRTSCSFRLYFHLRVAAGKRLSSSHYINPLFLFQCLLHAVLPFSRRSFQFGSGIYVKIFKSHHISLSRSSHFSSKNMPSLFVASLRNRPSEWPIALFSLAMFCTKLKKGLSSLRSAFRHVPRLTERLLYNRDPALQSIFVTCIIIGWLMLTNVPHVHKIIFCQSARPQIEFGTGI